MRYIIGCGRLALVGLLILLILAAIFLAFPFLGKAGRGRLIRTISGWIPAALGLNFTVKGYLPDEEAVRSGVTPDGEGYMVCANHRTMLDPFFFFL